MSKRDEPFDHAIYSAPWRDRGAEYGPTSTRTGRMVSQAVAESEFAQSFDAIRTQDHAAGGLWDFEQEAALRKAAGCKLPTAPERYDAAAMKRYADAHSHEFTDRELQVYTMFWAGKLSYGQIARHLGCAKERVRECVQRLKAKCDAAGYERPRW